MSHNRRFSVRQQKNGKYGVWDAADMWWACGEYAHRSSASRARDRLVAQALAAEREAADRENDDFNHWSCR